MNNLLIVEHNLTEGYFLINSICTELLNIRLYSATTTGIEAINIIKEKEVDIIILDLTLPDMTGMDILNYISKNNITKYESSIIAITDDMKLLQKIIGNKYIFSYCSKTSNINFIIDRIKELLNNRTKDINLIK